MPKSKTATKDKTFYFSNAGVRAIRAVNHLTTDEESRYMLHNVQLSTTDGHNWVAFATNGKGFLKVAWHERAQSDKGTFYIPQTQVKRALRKGSLHRLSITVNEDGATAICEPSDPQTVGMFSQPEGLFPDWLKLKPWEPAADLAGVRHEALDLQYLTLFGKAFKELTDGSWAGIAHGVDEKDAVKIVPALPHCEYSEISGRLMPVNLGRVLPDFYAE